MSRARLAWLRCFSAVLLVLLLATGAQALSFVRATGFEVEGAAAESAFSGLTAFTPSELETILGLPPELAAVARIFPNPGLTIPYEGNSVTTDGGVFSFVGAPDLYSDFMFENFMVSSLTFDEPVQGVRLSYWAIHGDVAGDDVPGGPSDGANNGINGPGSGGTISVLNSAGTVIGTVDPIAVSFDGTLANCDFNNPAANECVEFVAGPGQDIKQLVFNFNPDPSIDPDGLIEGWGIDELQVANAIPEPGSAALFGLGFLAASRALRRRGHAAR